MASVDFVKVGALVKVQMNDKKTHIINAKRDDLDISYNSDNGDVTVTLKGLTCKLSSITEISVNGVAVTDESDMLAKLATVFNEEGGGSGETPNLQAVSDVGDTTDKKLTMATLRATAMPEFADNTAAIAGELEVGDLYSLPLDEGTDVALVAIVRAPAPADPVVMKITVVDIDEWISLTSVTNASGFKTFMQDGGVNPDLVVSSYEVEGDEPAVITVRGSGLTTIPENRFASDGSIAPEVLEIESESVTEVGEEAFLNNPHLKKPIFPNLKAVDAIGNSAFDGCSGLEEVNFNSIVDNSGVENFFIATGAVNTVYNFNSLTTLDYAFNTIQGHTLNAPLLATTGDNFFTSGNITDTLNLASLHVDATDFASLFNGLLAESFTIGVTSMDGEYLITDNDFTAAIKSNHITFAALTTLSDAVHGSPFRDYGWGGSLITSDPLKLSFPALTTITGSPFDGIGSNPSLTDLSLLTIEVPAALASHSDVLAAQAKGATIVSL